MNQVKEKKVTREEMIVHLLTKFRVCSRNQLAQLVFHQNSNPVNVCNRVLRRMYLGGSVLQIKRERDKSYLYTANPSAIHHRSNKVPHCLKIVDFYIQAGCPSQFVVEPVLGDYVPDVMFKDKAGKSICVEIQLTTISQKKMQDKVNRFAQTFGKEHDARVLVICSDVAYKKIVTPSGFKLIWQQMPREVGF